MKVYNHKEMPIYIDTKDQMPQLNKNVVKNIHEHKRVSSHCAGWKIKLKS